MRICCLNNYPLEKMVAMAQGDLMPGQHGWGVQHLRRAGHEVVLAPFSAPDDRQLLDRASHASRHFLGQLDQQLWSVRRHPDVYYAADQFSLAGVAMARRAIARRTRLVSVVHHPLQGRGAGMRSAALRAHDAVATLSQRVCHELAGLGVRARFMPWGPDLQSKLYIDSRDGGFAISSGKSNRDVVTFVRALAETGYAGRVFDLGRTVPNAPSHVELVHPGGIGMDPATTSSYLATSVLDMTRSAGFVAIPISDPARLTGLTEINDALALGKPIVITRSPYTPIDVESVGCGIVVEPGDVHGWVAAINVMRDPAARREMGARGRAFAEKAWNYDLFGAELLQLLDEVRG
jgi:glycosyltransferase involved in cell wall biosynthesis